MELCKFFITCSIKCCQARGCILANIFQCVCQWIVAKITLSLHYCLLLCGDGKKLLIYVIILSKSIQWNLIGTRDSIYIYALEKYYEFYISYLFGGGKLKFFTCAGHSGNLITYNLNDDDDIQLKCGHFYEPVNSLCNKFKGTLSNPDADPNVMHIVVFNDCQQWYLSSISFDDICTMWQKAVRGT